METADPNYVLRALELFAEYGEAEALVRHERRLTYADLRIAILHLAETLRAQGVRSGARVAVLVDRPLEAPILQLAMHLLGTRTVWIDPDALRRDLGEYLRLVRPEWLIYDARMADSSGCEVAGLLGVPVLCLGPGGLGPDVLAPQPDRARVGSRWLERPGQAALGWNDGAPFDPGWASAEPDSVFQTSGTTGTPKLVHHRESFYRQVITLAEELVAAGEHGVRHVSISGLSYMAGQISALLYLFSGATLVLLDGFDLDEYLTVLETERITSAFIAPPMLNAILDSPRLATLDTSTLTMLSIGAAPATRSRLRQAIQRFGPVLRITYGLSECPFISALPNLAGGALLGSCGQPYGDVRVEIRAEDGTVLGGGEVGELWVRSDLNFAGYWGQPELTAQALVDGWVRTRDLGYRDADGFLYLVGRTQDMIIAGQYCEKVFPRPIEDTLTTHPRVRAAAVIGVPDPAFGEAAHAYVVTVPGATVTAEELTDLVGSELAAEWVPATFEFVDALPLTAIGKVNTSALRARYAAEHRTADIRS